MLLLKEVVCTWIGRLSLNLGAAKAEPAVRILMYHKYYHFVVDDVPMPTRRSGSTNMSYLCRSTGIDDTARMRT